MNMLPNLVLANLLESPIQLVLVLLVVLLIFGNRLPNLARSMGLSVSEFKKGVREGEEGEKNAAPPAAPAAPQVTAQAAQQTPAQPAAQVSQPAEKK